MKKYDAEFAAAMDWTRLFDSPWKGGENDDGGKDDGRCDETVMNRVSTVTCLSALEPVGPWETTERVLIISDLGIRKCQQYYVYK